MAFKPYPTMVVSSPAVIDAHNRSVKTRQVLRRLALDRGLPASEWRRVTPH